MKEHNHLGSSPGIAGCQRLRQRNLPSAWKQETETRFVLISSVRTCDITAAKHFPETTMEHSRVLWWKLAVQGILGLPIVRTRQLDLDYNMHRKQPLISPNERYTSSSNRLPSPSTSIRPPCSYLCHRSGEEMQRRESYTPTLTWIGSLLIIATDSRGPHTDERL